VATNRLVQLSPNGESEPKEEGIHERIAQSDGTSHKGARGELKGTAEYDEALRTI